MLGMSDLSKNVKKFYRSINSIENHRYKSWEHCYGFFRKIRNKEINDEELDLAQLHLAFYLASWGMYRGSGFILQKDYTIFKEIIKEILARKYSPLWDVEENIDKKEKLNELFIELYSKLEKILKKIRSSVKKHPDFEGIEKRYLNEKEEISPTLTTKILLGTLGCIPAYDRFFIEGLGRNNLQRKFNSKKSFIMMIEFYQKNEKELNNLLKEFENYPLMKILDMYFWVTGYGATNKRKDVEEE
jgi:hypothetical protein